MTALDAVVETSRARRAAEQALEAAIRAQRDAIHAAYADRWRVGQLAEASGLSRVTIHRVLTADTTDEQVA